jgi:peptidoglycan hydrolase CwlO-like protein
MRRQRKLRRGALVLAALSVIALLGATPSSFGDLSGRKRSLERGIGADNRQIASYEGRLHDLQVRLQGLETSLAIQRRILTRIDAELFAARNRLTLLRADLVRDRRILADQLVSQYESPQPSLVAVALQSHGFADLLERVDQMKLIARQNASVITQVVRDKAHVATQAAQLADDQRRQERVTAAVEIERDQVVTLRLDVLEHERVAVRDRAHRRAQLRKVRHQLAVLAARAAAAQRAAFAAGPATGGVAFASDGGLYGFFPAAGTNYSVGQEPEIAARLDRLGKALHLHLIGLSGYRSPQHSVEVGGFADDPHTRGEASDTPGVEGVPEQTLLQFGLTRPFPGAAEADHIQLA